MPATAAANTTLTFATTSAAGIKDTACMTVFFNMILGRAQGVQLGGALACVGTVMDIACAKTQGV